MTFVLPLSSLVGFLPPTHFQKTAGGFVLGSVAVSTDILLHILVAIASFLKFNMCNICKNNIAKMLLFFSKCKIVDFFLIFCKKIFCLRNLKNRFVDFHKILKCRYI